MSHPHPHPPPPTQTLPNLTVNLFVFLTSTANTWSCGGNYHQDGVKRGCASVRSPSSPGPGPSSGPARPPRSPAPAAPCPAVRRCRFYCHGTQPGPGRDCSGAPCWGWTPEPRSRWGCRCCASLRSSSSWASSHRRTALLSQMDLRGKKKIMKVNTYLKNVYYLLFILTFVSVYLSIYLPVYLSI